MRTTAKITWLLSVILVLVSAGHGQGQRGSSNTKDIRSLSQQFIDPKDLSP